MSEKKKTRTVSTRRLEDIRTRKELSTVDFLTEIAKHCQENDPSMNFQEAITAYAKDNSLRGTSSSTESDPVKDAIRATFPTLDVTKDCEVTLIRQRKENENKYTVSCKLSTGVTNTMWCEINGSNMTYGVQKITVGSCPLVGYEESTTDTVETDSGHGEEVYEPHKDVSPV